LTEARPASSSAGRRRLDALPFVHGYAGLGPAFAREVSPRGLRGARLAHLNRRGCALLDLDPEAVDTDLATRCFAGGELLPGSRPVATAYSGHQFGVWAGQLGDGRALLLGELRNGRGELWDVQLKGSGPTPFSRLGDGRAVWRSTLREYVAGEALAGLGIPTTRALALFTSDEPVHREETESGALLVRLARCHLRLGSFEHFHALGQSDRLRALFGYCLARWFPELQARPGAPLAFLDAVTERNARLVARWMAAGFCHGVMNTDNVSILGETLDYGPYAFLDAFDPGHVSNTSDTEGRYAFGRQPEVMLWNLQRFAEALEALELGAGPRAVAERVAERFGAAFEDEYRARVSAKLGLAEGAPGWDACAQGFLALLAKTRADFTRAWRSLAEADPRGEAPPAFDDELAGASGLPDWWRACRELRAAHPAGGSLDASRELTRGANPRYVARNHHLQALIEEPDPARLRQRLDAYLEVLASPCEEHPEHAQLAEPPRGGECNLSIGCSS